MRTYQRTAPARGCMATIGGLVALIGAVTTFLSWAELATGSAVLGFGLLACGLTLVVIGSCMCGGGS